MANYRYTTRTIAETPFAWNPLMVRFRMERGISVEEVSPGVYEEVRYTDYTDEIGAVNLPPNPNEQDTAFWPATRAGLHFFRGGYAHTVDDTVRSNLIASGVADASNFVLI